MDEPTRAFAEINGLRLYYEIHGGGSGRPLVLLHGGLLTIDVMFSSLFPTLAADRPVIALELQGHGHTADTDRAMSFDQLADDVAGLLTYLGIEEADVFGFSLGGLTGWSLVMRHPQLVRRFVVASADYRGDREAAPDEVPGPMPTEADFQAMRDAYDAVAPDPSHFEEFAEKTSTMVHTYRGWTADDLRTMEIPTMVVVGDDDFIRVSDALEAAELLPHGQLAVLPGTTHMDMTRSPERLLALIVPFLDA